MRKLTFLAAMAIVAATLVACGGRTPRAHLKTDVDSLSYAIGMTQTQGLKEYLVGNLGVDTAYIGEFIKGLNDGANSAENKKKAAYYAGIQIGQQIASQWVRGINYELFGQDSTQTVSLQNLMAGFVGGVTEKSTKMTMHEADSVRRLLTQNVKAAALERNYAPNREAGEQFLAENAKKEGVVTLESGVQYKVITEGTGKVPTDSSTVTVNYEGRTIDGTVFDSSYERKQPAEFACNGVIKGWTEVLTMMPVGSKWEVYIPQNLAYGERMTGGGKIKPYSALVFTIELLDVK